MARRPPESYGKDFTYKVFEGADHSLRIEGKLAEGVFEFMEAWLVDHAGMSVSGAR